MSVKSLAVEAYKAGTPSLLPNSNPYKELVEAHRWGRHHSPHTIKRCPVCVSYPA